MLIAFKRSGRFSVIVAKPRESMSKRIGAPMSEATIHPAAQPLKIPPRFNGYGNRETHSANSASSSSRVTTSPSCDSRVRTLRVGVQVQQIEEIFRLFLGQTHSQSRAALS